MPNVSLLIQDRAAAAYASELDYAISMHFSAAHLPCGSSPSLIAEQTPSESASPFLRTGQRRSSDSTQSMAAA